MAAKKSAQYPYQWPDGSWHSVPKATGPAKGLNVPLPLPPPPVGTYDPAIDYNASAANRGFQQTSNDAATAYEQGQQDYGIGLGDLLRGRDRNLHDLDRGQIRLDQDYGRQTQDLGHQFTILGRQQAERAAQQGITSQGLLGKSAQVRRENQIHDQSALDLAHNRGLEDITVQRGRTGEDYDRGVLGLNLGNARTFGGYGGNTILNPLTGVPEFGSLLTSLTRAGGENNAYQIAAAQQRTAGAAANGYLPPGSIPLSPQAQRAAALDFMRGRTR